MPFDDDELRAMSLEDIAALYDAIAEGRTRDALDIIYRESGCAEKLLHPATQLHLRAPRKAAA